MKTLSFLLALSLASFSSKAETKKETQNLAVEVTCYSYVAQPCGKTTTLCIVHSGPLTEERKRIEEQRTNKEICETSPGGGGPETELIQ